VQIAALESDRLRLEIAPQAGASVVSFTARLRDAWVPLWRPTPPGALASGNSSLMSSFALIPYSNRIRDARFTFRERSYALVPNTPEGHAIHGDVRKRPWRLTGQSASALELDFDSRRFDDINFPFPFAARLSYRLSGAELEIRAAVRNIGGEAMPAGIGFHPYYQRTLVAPDERVTLQAAVRGVFAEQVPTQPAVALRPEQDFSREKPVPSEGFDHCFTGWSGEARIRWPKSGVSAAVRCDATLDHLILFTPANQPFFALEPVSNANNGANLLAAGIPDSGVRVLDPGAELEARFSVQVDAGAPVEGASST
jgi:aldose 1-epimerase